MNEATYNMFYGFSVVEWEGMSEYTPESGLFVSGDALTRAHADVTGRAVTASDFPLWERVANPLIQGAFA